jgi:hypothetical protein
MNYIYRVLLCCSIPVFSSLNAGAIDTFITTTAATITTHTAAVTHLSTIFGTSRAAAAADLGDTLLDLSDTIDGVIGGSLGVCSEGQTTLLTSQYDAVVALSNRCLDHIFLGNAHQAVARQLEELATITTSQDPADIASTITTAQAALLIALTTYTDAYTLGVGDEAGILEEASWAEFLTEKTRATTAYNLAIALRVCSTDYTDFKEALDSLPSPDNDTVEDYDTSFLTAQNNIKTTALTALAHFADAQVLVTALTSSDQAGNQAIDFIAQAALNIQDKVSQFTQELLARKIGAQLAPSTVAIRVLQRQLLFDAADFTAKDAIKTALISAYQTQGTATADLNTAATAAAALIQVNLTPFEETPPEAAPDGERSNMGVIVDAKVTEYLHTMQGKIRSIFEGLNASIAQSQLDNITNTLMPAVYLQMTGTVMNDWLINRIPLILGFESLADHIGGYVREWNELVTILNATKTDTLISASALTAINSAQAVLFFANLFSNQSDASVIALKATALIKRPNGSVRQIMTQGNAEFQRILLGLLPAILSGSVSQPATIRTNAAATVAATRTVPEEPSTTISDSTVLNAQLEDGEEVLITGTGTLSGRLRDAYFSSSISNKLTADVKIFLNQSARLGLGTACTDNTSNSGQTLNLLGGNDVDSVNSVQLIPDGNCIIDLNSDIIIGGSTPIVPTAEFGKGEHRITFTSNVPRTITVLANVTWDLADFGTVGAEYADYGKQIVFAGKVRVVLEPGAKIRFPHVDPADIKKTVVLYFNDESEFIIQGDPLIVGNPWTDLLIAGSDCKRSKILGMGELWFSKNATMTIAKPALFGIEADYKTPKTDVTFSLQGEAQILIGTETIPGGAFQIGNMFVGGSKERPHSGDPDPNFPNSMVNPAATDEVDPFIPHKTTIDFTLRLSGRKALFQIGRQGFLGLAAGVINKDGALSSSNAGPNGITGMNNSSWQLQRLYNVGTITLDIVQGAFDHSISADGDSSSCSLLAIGKLANAFPQSKYLLRLGDLGKASIYGGGMLYFIDKDASMVLTEEGSVIPSPHTITDLTDTAADISFITSNTGVYAPLASSSSTRKRSEKIPGITDYNVFGRGIVKSETGSPYVFAGPTEEFFYALKLFNYNISKENFVPVSITNGITLITSVSAGVIGRTPLLSDKIRDGALSDALDFRYLKGSKQRLCRPTEFWLPVE